MEQALENPSADVFQGPCSGNLFPAYPAQPYTNTCQSQQQPIERSHLCPDQQRKLIY